MGPGQLRCVCVGEDKVVPNCMQTKQSCFQITTERPETAPYTPVCVRFFFLGPQKVIKKTSDGLWPPNFLMKTIINTP
eukprot:NODE_4446_length_661_cov_43.320261_g3797_i0.p2 GENE.NODE_4446_length_661_cov_43.320261_g3797_i0~~NODE_4446_length_661_cov_43.320261_g3797_i0.p2  ORF type:complete len:78 (-),score=2.96 NODE_4446_length_661_cov_43.320261_g3797_i0:25-258(-)